MNIRVLPALESREAWLAFIRREQPYCLVEDPQCLVDFQTSFLQLTLFNNDHRDAERYTLGSRSAMQPAWALIKGCNWSLKTLVTGLSALDFSSNVRDNELLRGHTDLSVRKRFVNESRLVSPALTGLLQPLSALPAQWSGESLCQLLANDQWRDWRSESDEPISPRALLLELQQHLPLWQVARKGERLFLRREGKPLVSFIPDPVQPAPRLAEPAL
ncbi:hypothetical protein ACQUQP_15490 [Marinobacterium sp. YM272]|uniref:hypothetical protein n=1 Tax=Marinobacterium sp. YM272 TaxID=3421654 RepID=UPI003D7F3073